eukprot:339648-Pyramimonas_sp.AAC.3
MDSPAAAVAVAAVAAVAAGAAAIAISVHIVGEFPLIYGFQLMLQFSLSGLHTYFLSVVQGPVHCEYGSESV